MESVGPPATGNPEMRPLWMGNARGGGFPVPAALPAHLASRHAPVLAYVLLRTLSSRYARRRFRSARTHTTVTVNVTTNAM